MAIFGAYAGAIKATYLELTEASITSGANTTVDIAAGIPGAANTRAGATYVVLHITGTGPFRVNIGAAADATSFLVGGSDEFICTIATDRPIGLWGQGGTPTVTIKRFII